MLFVFILMIMVVFMFMFMFNEGFCFDPTDSNRGRKITLVCASELVRALATTDRVINNA